MSFKVGDWVVHPQHGVGQVVKLETKQFGRGVMQLYYEITIAKSTIWVPVDAPAIGLRCLTTKGDLGQYRGLLKSQPAPLNTDHRQRQIELSNRLRQGSFQARCEVVRDLTALGWHKPLSEGNAVLLRLAREELYQEWAAVEGVSLVEATQEIETLLREAKQVYLE